jgi:hypothetical protein
MLAHTHCHDLWSCLGSGYLATLWRDIEAVPVGEPTSQSCDRFEARIAVRHYLASIHSVGLVRWRAQPLRPRAVSTDQSRLFAPHYPPPQRHLPTR